MIAMQDAEGAIKLSSDGGGGTMLDAVASTAVLVDVILMQQPGVFAFKPKKPEAKVEPKGPSPFSKQALEKKS